MVKEIETLEEFNALLAKAMEEKKLVIVDFHAVWCGPCKMIAPKIVAMEEEMKDTCIFIKVDVDEASEIAEKYEIQAMPTFLFFLNEAEVDKMTGANEAKLRETITKNIAKNTT